MSIPIETIRTDTFSMNFFRFGKGEKTLVILPGLSVQSVMAAADAVAAAYQTLENLFTVYVFDRRTELPEAYSIADMARDTAEVFRILGLKEVCLFGASQGGMIAQSLAVEHPELVGRLALGSTSPHIREEQYRLIESWIRLAENRDSVGLYLAFGEEIYPPAVFAQYRQVLLTMAETVTDEELDRFIILARAIYGFNITDKLDRIRCPVLVIGVYEDSVLGSDATMELAEKLDGKTDARLYLYVGYGHAAYDTAPDYRDRLLRFFTEA